MFGVLAVAIAKPSKSKSSIPFSYCTTKTFEISAIPTTFCKLQLIPSTNISVEKKNVSSSAARKSLSQPLRVQVLLKVEADDPTKDSILNTDAIDNVQVITHSHDHIPSAENLIHFCHNAQPYSNNIYCLIPPYVAQLITYTRLRNTTVYEQPIMSDLRNTLVFEQHCCVYATQQSDVTCAWKLGGAFSARSE
jgi:hypothetical protein